MTAAEQAAAPHRRVRAVHVAAGLVVLAIVGMWGYVFTGLARRDSPDKVDDSTLVAALDARCAAAVESVDALPPAYEASDASERAAVVSEANAALAHMLVDLRVLADVPGEDGRLLRLWLDDWDTFLADREAYVAALRAGVDDPFFVTDKDGNPITEFVDQFAVTSNDMASCGVPGDV